MTNQINKQSIIPSTDVIQLTLTLKMTTAQVVETSVTVNNNSPIQDYVHPDDQTQPFEMTPGFKPFTVLPFVSCLAAKTNCPLLLGIIGNSKLMDSFKDLLAETVGQIKLTIQQRFGR